MYLRVLQFGVDLLHVAVVVDDGGVQLLLHGGQPVTQAAHAALQLLDRQHRLLQLTLPARQTPSAITWCHTMPHSRQIPSAITRCHTMPHVRHIPSAIT